jgi:hypothetical protein
MSGATAAYAANLAAEAARQRKERIRQTLAAELKRKRDAGKEVPGTEWLRSWTDEVVSKPEDGDGR